MVAEYGIMDKEGNLHKDERRGERGWNVTVTGTKNDKDDIKEDRNE